MTDDLYMVGPDDGYHGADGLKVLRTATAPDVTETVDTICGVLDGSKGTSEQRKRLVGAIAKALGQEQQRAVARGMLPRYSARWPY